MVESEPFTSLEQAMLAETVGVAGRTRVFGFYHAVATVAGSLGALAAGVPSWCAGPAWASPATSTSSWC